MTVIADRREGRFELLERGMQFASSSGSRTNSEIAEMIFAAAESSPYSTPVTREPSAPRTVVRNSLIGLAAATSIFAGDVSSSAVVETGTIISPVRRANEVRQGTWWESAPERLGEIRANGVAPSSAATAADDLKKWLTLSDTEVAELCGFSRRSLLNWRNGAGAHGTSSRRLLSIHALIGHLMTAVGPARAGLWLGMDDGTGLTRLDALRANDDGMRRVLTQAEPLLFGEVPARGDFDSGLTDAEAARVMMSVRTDEEPAQTSPVRRVRRPSAGA